MNEIRLSIPIKTDQKRLFELLIDPKPLSVWFAEHADVSIDEDRYNFWGKYTPDNPREKEGQHKITAFEHNRMLSFEWKLRGAFTLVEYMLTPWDEGCVFHMRHSGLPKPHPNKASIGDFWTHVLEGFRSWIEHGRSYELINYGDIPRGDVELAIEIAAKPEEVYQALTDPAQLDRWISAAAKIDPRPGGTIDYGWGGGPVKILDVDPGKKLSYTWQWENEPETVTTWELEGSSGGTHLTVVQSGFAPDRDSGDYYSGWHKYINRLKSMLEQGSDWKKVAVESKEWV